MLGSGKEKVWQVLHSLRSVKCGWDLSLPPLGQGVPETAQLCLNPCLIFTFILHLCVSNEAPKRKHLHGLGHTLLVQ